MTRIEPLALRWAMIGAAVAGLLGGAAGLVIGLSVHPPTAWFAIFEAGIPASIFGGLIGLMSGTIACVVGRTGRHRYDKHST